MTVVNPEYDKLVYDRLNASIPLTTLLTGGLYRYKVLPVQVSRQTLPAVYSPTGLKRWMMVKGRAVVPDLLLRDKTGLWQKFRQVVEVYGYDDSYANFTSLKQAMMLVYELLHDNPVTGSFSLLLTNYVQDERDTAMSGAAMERMDFEIIGRYKQS